MERHGHSRRGAITQTYRAWRYMIQRCERPHNKDYARYGGRGITICEDWHLFDNFLKDMGEAPKRKTLGRIENAGNYCKANCRWETRKQQAANTVRNRYFERGGERLHVAEWARRFGVGRATLRWWIETLGWEGAVSRVQG